MKLIRFVLAIVLCVMIALHIARLKHLPAMPTVPAMTDSEHADAPNVAAAPIPKMNAYIEFNNRIVQWQHFDKEIQALKDKNREIQKPHADLSSVYSTSPSITADEVNDLKKAVAMGPSIPEVDPQARAMLTAVSAMQPTEQTLASYETSKEYLSDGGARARKLLPVLITQLTATDKAEVAFGHAIAHWNLKQDEALLKTLDKSSLQYLLLNDSLAARRLMESVNQYQGRLEAQHIDQLLPHLVAANQALSQYKGDTSSGMFHPKTYREQMDKVIGNARLLSAALKRDPRSFHRMDASSMTTANLTGDAEDDAPPPIVEAALLASYNESVDKLNQLNRWSQVGGPR